MKIRNTLAFVIGSIILNSAVGMAARNLKKLKTKTRSMTATAGNPSPGRGTISLLVYPKDVLCFCAFCAFLWPLLCGVSLARAADGWTATIAPVDEPLTNAGCQAYFVLEPGYQLVLRGQEDGEPAELIITVLGETREVAGVSTRVVEERETVGGALVEISRNFFALGVTTSNLYYFGEEVEMYKDGKVASHDGAWQAGLGEAKQGILLPGSIRIGDRYHQEQAPGIAMDRAENVSTNATFKCIAGTFTQCLKTKETTPLESGTEYKLYAPGIGLIKDGELELVKHVSRP